MYVNKLKSDPLPVKSEKSGTTCVSLNLRPSVLVPKGKSFTLPLQRLASRDDRCEEGSRSRGSSKARLAALDGCGYETQARIERADEEAQKAGGGARPLCAHVREHEPQMASPPRVLRSDRRRREGLRACWPGCAPWNHLSMSSLSRRIGLLAGVDLASQI